MATQRFFEKNSPRMSWGNDPNFTICFFSDGLVQLVQPSTRGSYFWWKKSGDRQLRLVGYPMIYRVLYIPGGCLEFLPSTNDALEKPEHCRNKSCEQHCVMTKQLIPYSERCFFSYGGILLQFATAKKRQALESVYIYSIGEDGHLPNSRFTQID